MCMRTEAVMERIEMGLWRIRSGAGDAWVRMRDAEAIRVAAEPVPASRAWVQIPVSADEIVTAWMQEWRAQVGD